MTGATKKDNNPSETVEKDAVNDQQVIVEVEESIVNKLINKYTAISSGVGLLPVPVLDLVGLASIQLALINALSKLYGVKFNKALAQSLIGVMVTTLPAHGIVKGGSSLLKMIPFIGGALGGVSLFAYGAASTYALGKVFNQHFASGGTFLTFNPEAVKEAFMNYFREKQPS